jgi:hypothetical protein
MVVPEPVIYAPPPPPVEADEIDWLTIGLGFLAVVAVMGLLPFWIFIFQLYR